LCVYTRIHIYTYTYPHQSNFTNTATSTVKFTNTSALTDTDKHSTQVHTPCIYTHTNARTHMCTHVYTHRRSSERVYQAHTYAYTYVFAHTRYAHTSQNLHKMRKYLHVICKCICMHTHYKTHANVNIYTHTHQPVRLPNTAAGSAPQSFDYYCAATQPVLLHAPPQASASNSQKSAL